MNEQLNEKISQFLDDELGHDETLRLLQAMQSQPELINTLNRYQAIGSALKTDVFLTVSPDFSAQISQQIHQDPHHFLPQRRFTLRTYQTLALAASVAVVAVLVGQGIDHPAENFNALPAVQLAQQLPPPSTPKSVVYIDQPQQAPLNSRISDYLQAHNRNVYTNGEASVRSLTQVTAYEQQ
jgi:sigma-E factor negative regulatory protein RseA